MKQRMAHRSLCRLTVFLLLLCLSAVGCGSKLPFDYTPVSGRITYDDGTPIPADGIRLQFVAEDVPPNEGTHPRPAIASVDSDGRFDCVTSYKYGDGLVPGKHRASIHYAVDDQGNSLVPYEYTSTSESPLIIDTNEAPLDFRIPRPK